MTQLRPLLVFGTRPEAIKMSPVLRQCLRRADLVQPLVCLTGQHREMLLDVVDYFGIRADFHLDLMTPDQMLAELTCRCLEAVDQVLQQASPDCVIVQGDTTTALATSLAAFYRRLPVVHVEAGLRTGDLQRPWPEELNRRVADMVAAVHCAPTPRAAEALIQEGAAPPSVHVTGNTVIDALLETVQRERTRQEYWQSRYAELGNRPLVLVTAHRRESFGPPLESICQAIAQLAGRFADHAFLYPAHRNPHVCRTVRDRLARHANVLVVDPVPYPEFAWLMDRSTLILTDSGGVQEEAPSLGKPVVVLRETTERPEVVEAGAARLAGTSADRIVAETTTLLTDPDQYAACQIDANPYGDGHAAQRIVDLLLQRRWAPPRAARPGDTHPAT